MSHPKAPPMSQTELREVVARAIAGQQIDAMDLGINHRTREAMITRGDIKFNEREAADALAGAEALERVAA